MINNTGFPNTGFVRLAVKHYLQDREGRSSYPDLVEQVGIATSTLEVTIGRSDPPVTEINRDAAYAFRDALSAKGNGLGTIRRRITTIKAVLNAADNRFDLPDWRNPFNGIDLPEDAPMTAFGSAQTIGFRIFPARFFEVWHLEPAFH